jgi:hypothetical protein
LRAKRGNPEVKKHLSYPNLAHDQYLFLFWNWYELSLEKFAVKEFAEECRKLSKDIGIPKLWFFSGIKIGSFNGYKKNTKRKAPHFKILSTPQKTNKTE